MNICKTCDFWRENHREHMKCGAGVRIDDNCPYATFGCLLWKEAPKSIEFEATVSGMFRGRIEDGKPLLELIGMSTEHLKSLNLGKRVKVMLEHLD